MTSIPSPDCQIETVKEPVELNYSTVQHFFCYDESYFAQVKISVKSICALFFCKRCANVLFNNKALLSAWISIG